MDSAVASIAPPVAGPPPTAPREETPRAAAFENHLNADLAARDSASAPEEKVEHLPEATAEPAPDQPVATPVIAVSPAAAAIDLQLLGGPPPESEPGEVISPAPLAPAQAQPQAAKPPAPKSAPAQPDDGAAAAPPVEDGDTAAPPPSPPAVAASAQGATPAPLPALQAAVQPAKPAAAAPETQPAKPIEAAAAKPDAGKRGMESAAKASGKSAAPEQQSNFDIAAAQLSLAEPEATSPTDPQLAPAGSAASRAHQAGAVETARITPATAQVAGEIIRRFTGKSAHFDLRLDPPELGRVEVRLEVSRDHRVTATVTADNPQALAELARHARELQQTLQSAGLELSDAGLSFDLRQGREGARDFAGEAARDGSPLESENDEIRLPPIQARPAGLERWRGVRVDVIA